MTVLPMLSSVRLPPLPSITDLLRLYKLRAKKQLSQNFLLDPRICNRIVKAAGNIKGCHVIEVGPGPGSLTRPIIQRGAKSITVIEKDRRFLPSLKLLSDLVGEDRFKIVIGDVLFEPFDVHIPKDLYGEWDGHPPSVHVIGNLPFSIATPLLIGWLKKSSERSGLFKAGRVPLTLTFQQEVAERIVAPIIAPQRCRLSAMVDNYCHAKYQFRIKDMPILARHFLIRMKGSSFIPAPDVDVGVVRLIPRREPLVPVSFSIMECVCNAFFNTKNKTIRRVLRNLVPSSHFDLISDIMEEAEVKEEVVVTHLSTEEIGRVALIYERVCKEYPEVAEYNFRLGRK